MAEYRYLFYDLLTNTPITELPLTGVSFTQQLNSSGTLSATILISDTSLAQAGLMEGTQPSRTALYVERSDLANGVGRSLVWGGVIWGREYNSATQQININAREFESYLERVMVDPYQMAALVQTNPNSLPSQDAPVQFSNVDQFQLVRLLVASAQVGNSNIGIQVMGGDSGATTTAVYNWKDSKPTYQALLDLSQSNNGFDFNVDVYYDTNGVPRKIMNLGYPEIGYRYSATDPNAPTLQLPGNMADYSYFEDGSLTANTVFVFGANDIWTSADNVSAITRDGYPYLQSSFNYSDITNTTLLQQIAQGKINALTNPPITLKITQTANQQPTVGAVGPGDDVRVSIRDVRFPDGLEAVYRVTALTVTPNDSGGPEQITYSLSTNAQIYS
jgi:hypothetical protein